MAEAEASLRAELARNPTDLQSQQNLAYVLDAEQRPEEALPLLRAVLRAKPDFAEARYLLGKILLAQGPPPRPSSTSRPRPGSPPRRPTTTTSSGGPTPGRVVPTRPSSSSRSHARSRPGAEGPLHPTLTAQSTMGAACDRAGSPGGLHDRPTSLLCAGLRARARARAPGRGPVRCRRILAVVLDLVVRDKKNVPIVDLKAEEVELFVDGAKQPFEGFRRVTIPTGGGPAVTAAAPETARLAVLLFPRLPGAQRDLARSAAEEFVKTARPRDVGGRAPRRAGARAGAGLYLRPGGPQGRDQARRRSGCPVRGPGSGPCTRSSCGSRASPAARRCCSSPRRSRCPPASRTR